MNNANIIGRIANQLELKHTQNGMAMLDLTIAVDKQLSKEKKEQWQQQGKSTTNFILCSAYGKLAETIATYFGKGGLIGINGNIDTSSYTDKNNQVKYITKIIIKDFTFLNDNRKDGQAQGNQGYTGNQNQPFANDYGIGDFGIPTNDDDIPF